MTEANTVAFDPGAWDPGRCEYGLYRMLLVRSAISEELVKPPPTDRLKALEAKLCSPKLQPQAPPPSSPLSQVSLDDVGSEASYISEGEPVEPSQPVSWGRGHRGVWWRVRSALREELVARYGISLSSVEVGRYNAGELLQQRGQPRALTGGPSQGCIRMPIKPSGWVTADASRCGGPQFLVRAQTPRWKVTYKAPAGAGTRGDVIVRSTIELDSAAVAYLKCGDVVEQAGPYIEQRSGLWRVPVIVSQRPEAGYRADTAGVIAKVSGWVTADASKAGGPVFLKLLQEIDGPGQRRRSSQSSTG